MCECPVAACVRIWCLLVAQSCFSRTFPSYASRWPRSTPPPTLVMGRRHWERLNRWIKVNVTWLSGGHAVSVLVRRDNATGQLYKKVYRMLEARGMKFDRNDLSLVTQDAQLILPCKWVDTYLTAEEKYQFFTNVPRMECGSIIALDINVTAVKRKRLPRRPWDVDYGTDLGSWLLATVEAEVSEHEDRREEREELRLNHP